MLTGFGGTTAGLVATGIGDVEMPQLVKGCHMPVAVAAASSTLLGASIAHVALLLPTAA